MTYVYAVVGCILVALGFVGAVLPLIPTTPFLLAALFCFARSSTRLHDWLVNHPTFGPYLDNYQRGTMERSHKIRTIVLLWVSLVISAQFIDKPVMWIVLGVIGAGVTTYLLMLKAPRPRTSG